MKRQFLVGVTIGILCLSFVCIIQYLKEGKLEQLISNEQSQESERKDKTKTGTEATAHILEYQKSPADNPLKGFVGYQGTGSYSDFPISLEYISIPMSQLVVGKDKYDWSILEDNLNEVASYGRQSIVSFYMDIPGSDIGINAIPKYLFREGLEVKEYTMESGTSGEVEVGYSPYYSNKALWEMAYSFVEELGTQYDGDVRIAQIEASIVGIWGEWHTSPYEFELEDSQLFQLGKTYDTAFNQTQISCRYPKDGTDKLSVGYSDYSFCYQSIIDEWSQWNQLNKYDLLDYWKTNMGGGELMPKFVKTIFETEDWSLRDGESYGECLQALHPSWLLVGSLTDFGVTERENAISAASQLGYDFTVTQAYYSNQLKKETTQMEIGVQIKNIGIAPFYYNWDSEIILLDQNENEVYREKTGWDLTQIQANGEEYKFIHSFSLPELEEATYTIVYQVINPLKGGYCLRFANETQENNGNLVLGEFSIGNIEGGTLNKTLEKDGTQDIMDKHSIQVTSKFLNDEVLAGEQYILGVRIRNFGDEFVEDINKVMINVYYNNKCIDSISTDWKIGEINPNNSGYYAWQLAFEETGVYDLKLQFLPGLKETEIGRIQVK